MPIVFSTRKCILIFLFTKFHFLPNFYNSKIYGFKLSLSYFKTANNSYFNKRIKFAESSALATSKMKSMQLPHYFL